MHYYIHVPYTFTLPSLNPIAVKSTWYRIGIDFIGPLSPAADDGSTFILIVSDYFSKWVEAVPTPDKSAATVSTTLFKVWYIVIDLLKNYI